MGFSYVGRKLACAACSNFGSETGVRKRKCPAGYCPSTAYCKTCWKGAPGQRYRQYHEDNHCQDKSDAYNAVERRKREARAAGMFLLDAGFGEWKSGRQGMVLAVFSTGATYAARAEAWYLIPEAEYEKRGEHEPLVTPECFPNAEPTDLR